MDVKIDADAMQSLVTKAVFDGLTGEKRDALIQGAIKSLLETPRGNDRNYYGTKVSPLQEAFNRAIEMAAHEHAIKFLAEDAAFQDQLKKLFADVAEKLFTQNRDATVDGVVKVITSALSKDRY